MNYDFSPTTDHIPDTNAEQVKTTLDIPAPHHATLEGRDVVVTGDTQSWVPFMERQGDNAYQMPHTCSLSNCAAIINRFAGEHIIDQNGLIAATASAGFCDVRGGGLMSLTDTSDVLRAFKLESHIEHNPSLESLASNIESGRGVILEVKSSVLNDQASYGNNNHTVTLTSIVRDPATNLLVGAYYFDPKDGTTHYANASKLENAVDDAVIVERREADDSTRNLGGACVTWTSYYHGETKGWSPYY